MNEIIGNNKNKLDNFRSDLDWIKKSSNSTDINEYGHIVSRADWWKRWLYSTNAKDIGMLYIYFAIFSGIFIIPLYNLAICWEILLNMRQSTGNLYYYFIIRILRDFTQELSLFSLFLILSKNI